MKPGKVRIEIAGTQRLGTEQDETFVEAQGTYEREQDAAVIQYIEKPEETLEILNCIRVQENGITISKRGAIVSDMYFEEGKNINEDGFFMFQCYMRKPLLVRHNISVYKYNVRSNSCSRQKFSDKYLSMIYFCDKKKDLISDYYPQYINETRNMEIFTYLQLLDILYTYHQ